MAFQPCPHIAQVEMVYFLNGQIVENVYHVLLPGEPTLDDLVALVGTFDDWDGAAFHTHRVNTSYLEKVVATDLERSDGPRYEFFLPTPRAGTNTSAAQPNNVTVAVSFRTARRGRSFRGRAYVVGLPSSFLDSSGQLLNSTGSTALLGDYNALLGAVAEGGVGQLCVLSRRSGGAPRTNGIGTPVTSVVLADVAVDSQRRRLPFHNRHH